MEACAGECDDDSHVAACLDGAPGPAMHVVHARSAREARAMSKSASLDDLSHRYGLPYDERGRVCVAWVACSLLGHRRWCKRFKGKAVLTIYGVWLLL